MKIGVDVVVLGNCGPLAIVKEPDGVTWIGNGTEFDLVSRAGTVDMRIQAVMKKVVAVASGAVCWADPEAFRGLLMCIGSPALGVVVWYAQLGGEINVPAVPFRSSVGGSIFGEPIFMIQGVELGGQSPLLEVVQTDSAFDALSSFLEAGQCQRAQDGDD